MARIGRFTGMASGPYGAALSTVQPIDNVFPILSGNDGTGGGMGRSTGTEGPYTWTNADGSTWNGLTPDPILANSNGPIELFDWRKGVVPGLGNQGVNLT